MQLSAPSSPAPVSLPQPTPPLSIQLAQKIETLGTFYLSLDYLSQIGSLPSGKSGITEPLTAEIISEIAATYGTVCIDLWLLATTPHQSTPQQLNQHLHQLCSLWIRGKQQLHHPLFTHFSTPPAAREAAWNLPIIQHSLKQATQQLYAGPTAAIVCAYPTDWAYACGLVMNQLLQWNHRLASQLHREFLNQPTETAEAAP